MNILLINGSPKGKRSNSLRLAEKFIEGMRWESEKSGAQVEVNELEIASLKINPCKGCFACWQHTPGVCCIKDDMQTVIEEEIAADLIIWSFPLYYFNVPGILKNLIDRQLPMNLPFMSERTDAYGSGSHESRYDMKRTRHVLISTCGFYSAQGNYDSVLKMYDHFLGQGNYTTLFCGQGELFRVKELSGRTDEYLTVVKQAGAEYAAGGISEETERKLQRLLYPKEVFEEMADASWGISKDTGEKEADDLIFTRQMAALYKKDAYDGKDRVLEMCYTDLGTTYQILLGKDGSKVYTDGSLTATTRVDTPFEVWLSISRGEIEGSEALGRGMYSVTGDFSLMINWDRFFGSSGSDSGKAAGDSREPEGLKPPAMTTMLIPWIAFWIAVSINAGTGAVVTLAVTAFVPFLMKRHRFVIWDQISMAAVALLSAAANMTGNGNVTTNAGYLIFGLMWLGSCLTKEPLCAAYVKYNYGGGSALKNPIFMKTNYILAACWGILYVLTALWTWILRRMGLGYSLLVINNLVPVVMGIFTVWFEKWYPARVARGGGKKRGK